jgi:hypothetical protein
MARSWILISFVSSLWMRLKSPGVISIVEEALAKFDG